MNEKEYNFFPKILSKNNILILKHHTIFKIQCKQSIAIQ